MPSLVDRTKEQYGELVVISRVSNDRFGNARWVCFCRACGRDCVVLGQQLTKGQKSCGCVTSHLRPFESLYNRLLSGSSHPVILTYEEFEKFTQVKECHYCGQSLIWRERYAGRGGWQLDRKDTAGIYSADNCVPCCKRCNRGKSDLFTYAEWVKIGKLIKSWKK